MKKTFGSSPADRLTAGIFLIFSTALLLSKASAAPFIDGALVREVWTNVPGIGLAQLTNRADFPNQPTLTEYLTSFEAPNQFGDNYGQRLAGLLRPPISGDYVFYISSDDEGALFLSTDGTAVNKRLIAREPMWSPPRTWTGTGFGRPSNENQSAPIRLEAGRTYYIEALHKEGGGGDSLGVTWQKPGDPEPENGSPPIPGEYFVGQPTAPVPTPATGDQDRPAVASDGAGFFVVWQDRRNYGASGATDYDIYGSRVSASGEVLDAAGIRICVKEGRQENPAVAFDGENYLVIWEEHLDGISGSSIWARRVTRQGQLLDGQNGFVVSQGNWLESNPRLAWNGSTYLAVWIDWRHYAESISDIYGARIDGTGTVLDPAGIKIYQAPLWQTWPVVAARDGKFLVVWSDMNSLKGTFVNADGTVLNPIPLTVANIEGEGQPALAAGSNGFLVTWHETRVLTTESPVYDEAVIQRPLGPNGEPNAPSLRLNWGDNKAHHSAIATSGNLYRVVWGSQDTSGHQIKTVLTPTTMGAMVVNSGRQPRDWPSIAYNGTKFLIAWTDRRHVPLEVSSLGDGDIYAVLYGSGPPDTNGFLVSSQVVLPPLTNQGWNLDPTFDPSAHRTLTGLEGSFGWVASVVLQTDGKTVIGGKFMGVNGFPSRNIARLLPSGAPDTAFRPSTGPDDSVAAVEVQQDGCVLLGGHFGKVNGIERPWLARLKQDGSLDSSFTPELDGPVHFLALQRDGRILIGGSFRNLDKEGREYLARLQADGRLDRSFVPAELETTVPGTVMGLLLTPDERVLVARIACNPLDALRRLNADGSTDASFSFRTTHPQCDGVKGIALAPDGRIYYIGSFALPPEGGSRSVGRLLPDGLQDTSFEQAGLSFGVQRMWVQPDGKLVVGGHPSSSADGAPKGLTRFNTNGSLDTTFQVPESVLGEHGRVLALAARPDGRLMVGRSVSSGFPPWRRALVQLRLDGSVDPSFEVAVNSLGAGVHAILPLGEGRCLLGGGFSYHNNTLRQGIVSINRNGTLDRSFAAVRGLSVVYALARQPDGKILAAGSVYDGVTSSGMSRPVVRLHSNGAVDPSFVSPLPFGGSIFALALQSDGAVLVGGGFTLGDDQPKSFVRLQRDGRLDTSFPQGKGFEGEDLYIRTIAVQPDGRILVGGLFERYNGQERTGIVRLMSNGTLDPTFPEDANGLYDVWRMSLMQDGRVLLLSDGRMHRLLSDGTRDSTFKPTLPNNIYLWGFAPLPDGRIVVYGYREESVSSADRVVLAMLAANGTVEASIPWDMGRQGEISAIMPVSATEILFGGSFEEVNGSSCYAIARLVRTATEQRSFVTRALPGSRPGSVVTLTAVPTPRVQTYAVQDQPPEGWLVREISDRGVFDPITRKVKFGPFFDDGQRSLSYQVIPPPGAFGTFTFQGEASADGVSSPIIGDSQWVLPSFHPADLPAADWRITIDELTAYATAWRAGVTNSKYPEGVPISYVTRAAALWRGGELYRYDPGAGAPPMCWVNTNRIGLVSTMAVEAMSKVVRQAPDVFVAGGTVKIALEICPAAGAQAFAAEEQLPVGYEPRAMSDGGVFVPAERCIRWGPFLDGNARTLTYELMPRRVEPPYIQLHGTASFDGWDCAVEGPNTVRDGSGLSWRYGEGHASPVLQLRAWPGDVIVIESSNDLLDWSKTLVLTNASEAVDIPITPQMHETQRFYRARRW